jgi:hypothetical protein
MFEREKIQVRLVFDLVKTGRAEVPDDDAVGQDEAVTGILDINMVGDVFDQGVQKIGFHEPR